MTQAILIPEIGVLSPKQIIFRGSDYSPDPNNVIAKDTPTPFDFTMNGVADGDAWQSAKADIGSLRATLYAVKVCLEFFSAPSANSAVHFFWSPSETVTAAVGNDGGVSGADEAYTGYSTDHEEAVRHLIVLGTMVPVTSIAVQCITVGFFQPSSRYGSLIVFNESGVTLAVDDGIETAVVFNPVTQQGQDT